MKYYIPLLVSEGATLKLLANRRCEGGVCVTVLASFFSKLLPEFQGKTSSQIIVGWEAMPILKNVHLYIYMYVYLQNNIGAILNILITKKKKRLKYYV